ncbi:hypothetical protein CLOSTASPAR_01197 [[Clostridium] asparagiforme DSM 15981]|uniref:Uncharacterized protein n=1 Tax=[Clostridium] asparagiforme DSM 15981 TaxID=518636 RepID=C0CW43_9FIRM|nr:hypothetical protein CLOSTASPAR_01197 [[Clostridium] asparagiforme DSM 15981]
MLRSPSIPVSCCFCIHVFLFMYTALFRIQELQKVVNSLQSDTLLTLHK